MEALLYRVSDFYGADAGLQEREAVLGVALPALSLTDEQLLSHLQRFCKEARSTTNQNQDERSPQTRSLISLRLTCVAAAATILQGRLGTVQQGVATGAELALHELVLVLFLPTLRQGDNKHLEQVAARLCCLIRDSQAWSLAMDLLSGCAVTICFQVPSLHAHPSRLDAFQPTVSQQARLLGAATGAADIPWRTAVSLVHHLLLAASGPTKQNSNMVGIARPPAAPDNTAADIWQTADGNALEASPSGVPDNSAPAGETAQLGLSLLLAPALAMVCGEDIALRRAAQHGLLPPLLQCAAAVGPHALCQAQKQLWAVCREAASAGGARRRSGLAAMVQFSASLLSQSAGAASVDPATWQMLQGCLADGESLNTKRAFFLLRRMLQPKAQTTQPWASWLKLYELLDEFPIHLVEDGWGQIKHLHKLDPGKRQGQRARLGVVSEERQHVGSGCASEPFDAAWMEVLWRRGLSHRNPKVQRHILQTFLERDWPSNPLYPAHLSTNFLVNSLLPALCNPYHYQAGPQPELVADGCKFLKAYATALSVIRQRQLVLELLDGLPEGRLSLQLGLSFTAAAAAAAAPTTASAQQTYRDEYDSNELKDSHSWPAQVLSRLRALAGNFRELSGSQYRLKLYHALLDIATATTQCHEKLALPPAAQFLAELPLASLQPGGELRLQAADWLQGGFDDGQRYSQYVSDCVVMLEELYRPQQLGALAGPVSPAEVQRWQVQAVRWSRLVMLLKADVDQTEQQRLLHKFDYQLRKLHRSSQQYLPHGSHAKTLLLLQSLQKAASPAGRAQSVSWLQRQLASIIAHTASELTAYTEDIAHILFQAPDQDGTRLSHQQNQPQGAEMPRAYGAYEVKLAPPLEDAVLMANLSLQCSFDSLILLESTPSFNGATPEPHWRAVEELKATAVRFLQNVLLRETAPCGVVEQDAGELRVAQVLLQNTARACCSLLCCFTAGSCAESVTISASALIKALMQYSAVQLQHAKWTAIAAAQQLDANVTINDRDKDAAKHPSQMVGLLVAAVGTVESVPKDTLLSVFACIRLVLQTIVSCPDAAASAARGIGTDSTDSSLTALMWAVVRPCWAALLDADKRSASLTAAFVASVLLPQLFAADSNDDARLALHGDDGPMVWVVEQLLEVGERSPRLLAITALQLAGLWVCCPRVAALYADQMKRLLTENVADRSNLAAGHGEISGGVGEQVSIAELVRPLDPTMADLWAATEVAPRAAVLCCLHRLAILAGCLPCAAGSGEMVEIASAERAAAGKLGLEMWQRLVTFAKEDDAMQNTTYSTGTDIHRLKVRVWQAICVLTPFHSGNSIPGALQQIWACLKGGEAGSVRQYQETACVWLLLKQPHLAASTMLPALHCYSKRSEGLASSILVGAQFIFHAPPAVAAQWKYEFASAVLPWCFCHNHGVRTLAQLVQHQFLQRFPELVDPPLHAPASAAATLVAGKCSIAEGAAGSAVESAVTSGATADGMCQQHLSPLHALLTYLDSNADFLRMRRGLGPLLEGYDPWQAVTPAGVLHYGSGLAGSLGEGVSVEGAKPALLDAIAEFLQLERTRVVHEQQQPSATSLSISGVAMQHAQQETSTSAVENFQRKPVPQEKAALVAGSGSASMPGLQATAAVFTAGQHSSGLMSILAGVADDESEEVMRSAIRDASSIEASGPRQQLILVATLIDKAVNLGGLARTCEVFRAGTLVVPDMGVAKDPAFLGVSVTANHWLPMVEVRETDLIDWLLARQRDGYALVGLEQTAESCGLPDYNFPSKTALVLGREKEGMPPQILAILDAVLEIPQFGMVRSLNVHVSGAIAMYEFTKQRARQLQIKPG